jgi:hypothetical protein
MFPGHTLSNRQGMKTWIRSSVLIIALALGFGEKVRAVANGGFETGDFTGWSLSGNTSFTSVIAEAAHSGAFGASFGAVGSETLLAQLVVPTTPGASYSLDFWLKNLSGATTNSFSAWWDGVLVTSLFNSAAFDYTGFSFPVVASGASTVLEFRFRHDPSFWNFDDVSITPVGVPDGATTVGLLGIALIGLSLLRRNRR